MVDNEAVTRKADFLHIFQKFGVTSDPTTKARGTFVLATCKG